MSLKTDEDGGALFKYSGSVKCGQVERFIIKYTPPTKTYVSNNGSSYQSLDQSSLFLKIKNTSSLTRRAAYLMGPFILYCDLTTQEYDHNCPCYITADQPQFDPNLQPNQTFTAELSCHTIKKEYIWIVNVASQILFSSNTSVDFEILIGDTEKVLQDDSILLKNINNNPLMVTTLNTDDLWNLPPPKENDPVHLVVLTHGLHSNVGADMLYLKEQIESASKKTGDNIMVRGYHENICKTERGIKYLGMKVAEYIVGEVYKPNITQISFVGHSLGGLIQTFAIAYIEHNFPWFFKFVTPINFITLASPLLGISHMDSPGYVQTALGLGVVGRTGLELGLKPTEINGTRTTLELLPSGITNEVLKKFKNRTIYANAVNDGIVPLRTSALLFLDYSGLRKVAQLMKLNKKSRKDNLNNSIQNLTFKSSSKLPMKNNEASASSDGSVNSTISTKEDTETIGEIPDNMDDENDESKPSLFAPLQNAFTSWIAPQSNYNENPLPKTSIIESAKSILLPPLPSKDFIIEPESRKDPIIHDKIYSDEDLCKFKIDERSYHEKNVKHKTSFKAQKDNNSVLNPFADNFSNFFGNDKSDSEILEEKIAMQWHEGMSWRKVLVNIEPDAHNNIIVRRRFINAFGWPVIDHLTTEHFGEIHKVSTTPINEEENEESLKNFYTLKPSSSNNDRLEIPQTSHNKTSPSFNQSSMSYDMLSFQKLKSVLWKEALNKENSSSYTLPKYVSPVSNSNSNDWINTKNYKEGSLFEIGPTGLLANVNDRISKII